MPESGKNMERRKAFSMSGFCDRLLDGTDHINSKNIGETSFPVLRERGCCDRVSYLYLPLKISFDAKKWEEFVSLRARLLSIVAAECDNEPESYYRD